MILLSFFNFVYQSICEFVNPLQNIFTNIFSISLISQDNDFKNVTNLVIYNKLR